MSCSWPARSENICSPDQRTARPSSALTPLPSPKQTKLIVSAGPVGAGRPAGRRPQAEVPPARAPPDTQGIVPQSTAPGHLCGFLACPHAPHRLPLRQAQPAGGPRLPARTSPPTPSSPLMSYNCFAPSCRCHSLGGGIWGSRQAAAAG